MDNTSTALGFQDVFRIVHDAVAKGAWWPLAGLALVFVVSAARKLAVNRMGKVGAWLATDHGAIVLAFIVAGIGGLGASLLGGASPTKSTLVGALMAGASAVVAFPTVQKFFLSWFGVELGLQHWQKMVVTTRESGAQRVREGYEEVTAVVSPGAPPRPPASKSSPPDPPPPIRSGDGGRVDTSLIAAMFALLFVGCALSWPDITRVTATSLNKAVIAGGPLAEARVKQCGKGVDRLTDAGKLVEARAEQASCETLRTNLGAPLVAGKTAATTALAVADSGEKLKIKRDFAGVLAPVLKAASDLVKVFEAAGIVGLPPVEGVGVQ